mmetsp:Transcript_26593/g.43941  ORF Transcript_26593/g.43941 Transcript_26593/m.43941 type:complete len:172 (-) Transcript_26593:187-702(-)
MASNQFTESVSESDTLQHLHLEPLPFSNATEMTSARGFHSQLQLEVAPPPPKKRRRRGRHPLSSPGLPTPSDNNSTTAVSCSRSSKSSVSASASASASESKHGRAWEQRIHELVSLRIYNMFSFSSYIYFCFRSLFAYTLFSSTIRSIFRRSMVIVMYHRITHQTPASVPG